MRKRVLLAEQSDAIRGVAETVLRQNNFEVISVRSAEKAQEVLNFTRPDVLIVGADLFVSGQKRFCEKVQENPQTSSLAMLIMADPSLKLPFPPEVIIPKPLDPNEFVEKVMMFSGRIGAGDGQSPDGKLQQADVNDAMIDEALGLNHIDVTDSAVLGDRDSTGKMRAAKATATDSGLGYQEEKSPAESDSGKVESVLIREGETPGTGGAGAGPRDSENLSASSKLEILPDQYGLSDPGALKTEREHQAHDYEWFINEMRKDAQAPPSSGTPATASGKADQSKPDLEFAEPSSIVDPVTPPPAGPPLFQSGKKSGKTGDVEKFLSEFKQEVERIQAGEPDSVSIGPEPPGAPDEAAGKRIWRDTEVKVTEEQVSLFTDQLCRELAERLAEKIAA
ncbi:MAG: hypothetical protein AB1744_08180, partial [Candidatus Zixiibacteriota bacterium]